MNPDQLEQVIAYGPKVPAPDHKASQQPVLVDVTETL
jgi:hypothetical protein